MKSICSKLMLCIGIIVCLSMSTTALITTKLASDAVLDSENKRLINNTELTLAYIDNYFSSYITKMQQLSIDPNIVAFIESDVNHETLHQSPYYNKIQIGRAHV